MTLLEQDSILRSAVPVRGTSLNGASIKGRPVRIAGIALLGLINHN
eukprot:CAMPEP_0172567954 /NCGR_PEP_ID=MMETSP1067-20121228/117907_1 /TAXON_ID=265564 ORGANISM="Thalassiosira punctigera, Strain Tpunct2005C2" /NCGR_SAMPLE_ID=MMETSP1067 /ASSEMBLY_ACC=CAM_ASM_000444 /LENGTH=45 /DNA_ID= /DNA_START= /DNA_END= /DNA_ORIENTATION=